MGWGEKAIEIRSVSQGLLDGVFMHKRANKLKFLCERNDKVFFASVQSPSNSQVQCLKFSTKVLRELANLPLEQQQNALSNRNARNSSRVVRTPRKEIELTRKALKTRSFNQDSFES